MGILDIFTNQNAQDAANAQISGINSGYSQLGTLFNQGANALTQNYTQALAPFTAAQQTGAQGTAALGNALGLNGAAGNASATQSFWNNPAIQSQLNIGSQNVLRNQAATGQLNSGKTNVDLQNLGQQTASNGWNSYISSLQPYLQYGLGAASGGANVLTGLGSGLNANDVLQGNAAYGAQTSAGNAQANADLANNNASANIWNALMGGAKLATSGGLSGLSSIFSGGGAGSGLASAGSSLAMFSDARLKEDIEPVGELFDGTNVYSYRYKGDATPRIGLMAQEVEKVRPDAVTEIAGFKAVDYAKATQGARDYAAAFGRFLKAA